ncbi:MAG TPA: hypothetical protein VGV17_15910 [Bosea sp. (in: a-proteobacteria)]|jgi:hypothetical protein|uniref:hypothetical protein n=1 Tax=Bosea sp. (in: a-proteobacteria) TaxID=1871050 RepID=UPI002DDDA9E0|nr:hypothetical protein [Bosea sp. (in: a-proteobacteria)]HEV2555240.1 hypothetical protein [Bosea sp. (in: a-proteobacteria)]
MNTRLSARLAKLESDAARTGVRYVVSSRLLSNEEWAARLGDDIVLVTDEETGEPILTDDEWEAAHVALADLHR